MPVSPLPVEIWFCDLDRFAAIRTANASTSLSRHERERASRFRYDIHRERFLATRIVLRNLLGAYMGVNASDVCFSLESRGKPRLDPNVHAVVKHFNLSHSGNMAAFFFADKLQVGIDLENAERSIDIAGVSQTAFSDEELTRQPEISDGAHRDAFFRHWTLREAMFKAMGIGLPADRKAFNLMPASPGEWQIESSDGSILLPWRARAIDLPAPWMCSIAANGPFSTVSIREFGSEMLDASSAASPGQAFLKRGAPVGRLPVAPAV